MVDSVIAGTGNSRYLRTSIGADTTWAEALEMLRAGTFPIDLAGINQAGFSTLGTALNSDTLLKSAVIIALGLDSDATPSDAWEAVLALIDAKADADSAVTAVTYDTETKTLSATINGTSTAIATFDFVNAEEAAAAAPVQSVAGKTGEVSLDAGDVAYDETATYNDGTVGAVVTDLQDQLAAIYPTDTASGSIASFDDGADGVPVKSLVVNIAPVQSGTGDPSPENVRPISGWDSVNVRNVGESYPIDLPQTVYGGTLDVASGTLTIDRQVLTLDGSESWGAYTAGNPYGTCFRYAVAGFVEWANARQTLMCDRFTVSALANPTQNTGLNGTFWLNSAGDGIRFVWGEPNAGTTVAEWTAWLADNPVTVVGKMATPITVQLTPTEVTTRLGVNNIWADTGDVDVTYRADVQLYVNKKAAQTLTAAASMLSNVETGMTATRAYAVNDFLSVNGQLYRVTAAIANGATITPGTNVTETTVGAQITALLNA